MILRLTGQQEDRVPACLSGARVELSEPPQAALSRYEHPAEWLALARRCPNLARLLATATRSRDDSASADPAQWARVFAHHPPWGRVACLLADFNDSRPALDTPKAVAVAFLAASIARQTGWTSVDAAHWHALCRASEPVVDNAPWATLGAAERCRRAAHWLLSEPTSGAINSTSTPVQLDDRADDPLVMLQTEYPGVDWSLLMAEASGSVRPAACELSRELIGRLWQSAELARSQDELRTWQAFDRLVASTEPGELLGNALALSARLVPGSLGLWLAVGPEQAGVARTLFADTGRLGEVLQISRPAFEEHHLPAALRCACDLRDTAGTLLGRFYYTSPGAEAEWKLWQARIATVLARTQRLADLESEVERRGELLQNHLACVRRQASQRVRAAIAELAAGAGHEINNPLATIAGKAQWLLGEEVDPARRQALQKIGTQVDRIHRMIRDLHLIGRERFGTIARLNLAPILSDALANAAARKPAARVTLEPTADDLCVQGNREDLVRLVTELIANGIEAAGRNGWVLVRARAGQEASTEQPATADNTDQVDTLTCGHPEPDAPAPATPGVLIEVIDSGPGLTVQDRLHALDPFYSGRSAGRGLGMGLPVAWRIAQDHGGQITISLGRPTTVAVTLPLTTPTETG